MLEGPKTTLPLAAAIVGHPDFRNNQITTRWLEEYLVKQPEGMLIVSHDRYFLDRVVTKVFEMSSRRLTCRPASEGP